MIPDVQYGRGAEAWPFEKKYTRSGSDESNYSDSAWPQESPIEPSARPVSLPPGSAIHLPESPQVVSPKNMPSVAPLQVRKLPGIDLSACEDHYATDVRVAPFFEDSLEDYDAMKLEEFMEKMALNGKKTKSRRRLGFKSKNKIQPPSERLFDELEEEDEDDEGYHTTLAMQTVLSKVATEHLGRYPAAAGTLGGFDSFFAPPTAVSPISAAGVASALGPETSSGFASIYVLDYVRPQMERAADKARFRTTLYVSHADETPWVRREYEYRQAALDGRLGAKKKHDEDEKRRRVYEAKEAAHKAASLASRKSMEDYYYDKSLTGIEHADAFDSGEDEDEDEDGEDDKENDEKNKWVQKPVVEEPPRRNIFKRWFYRR